MKLIIDGRDVSQQIKRKGITRDYIYRNELTRVTIGGKRYSTKIKKLSYTISFDPMAESDLRELLSVLDQDYVSVLLKDPSMGYVSSTFIPNVDSVDLILEDNEGVSYWSGLVVTLEEQ